MGTHRAQRVQPRGYPLLGLGPGMVDVFMLLQALYTTIDEIRPNARRMGQKGGQIRNQHKKLGR